jgi:hypothetical protein
VQLPDVAAAKEPTGAAGDRVTVELPCGDRPVVVQFTLTH